MQATVAAATLLLALASPALAGRMLNPLQPGTWVPVEPHVQQQHHTSHHGSGTGFVPQPQPLYTRLQPGGHTHQTAGPGLTVPGQVGSPICHGVKSNQDQIRYAASYWVPNFQANCLDPKNSPCATDAAERNGCSLYAHMEDKCKALGPNACQAGGLVYTDVYGPRTNQRGSLDCGVGHVITIAVSPVRGLDDVFASPKAANSAAGEHFHRFWADSVASKSGGDGHQGFDADQGALVINPAAHREYHQLHIHGGAWRTPKFQRCVAKMTESANWQLLECPGLSEGGVTCVGAQCQTAQLAYKAVDSSALGSVFDLWREAVGSPKLVNIKASAGSKTLLPTEASYHAGLLVTRNAGLKAGKVFVAVYAPVDDQPDNGLGRGHFVMKGTFNSHQDCTCTKDKQGNITCQ